MQTYIRFYFYVNVKTKILAMIKVKQIVDPPPEPVKDKKRISSNKFLNISEDSWSTFSICQMMQVLPLVVAANHARATPAVRRILQQDASRSYLSTLLPR